MPKVLTTHGTLSPNGSWMTCVVTEGVLNTDYSLLQIASSLYSTLLNKSFSPEGAISITRDAQRNTTTTVIYYELKKTLEKSGPT